MNTGSEAVPWPDDLLTTLASKVGGHIEDMRWRAPSSWAER